MQQKFVVRSSHFQIGIWDAESNDSYPEFSEDDIMHPVIFGAKGVIITTEGFSDIQVHIVSKEESKAIVEGTIFLGEGVIQIGHKGLEVGNIVSDSIKKVM